MHSGERQQAVRTDEFLAHVKELVSPQQYDTWFGSVVLVEGADQALELLVPNAFVRDWLSNYYSDKLALAIERCFGEDRRVTVLINPDAPTTPVEADPGPPSTALRTAAPAAPSGGARAAAPGAGFSDTVLHPDYNFDNFVVGTNNRFAHAASVAVAEAPGRSYNPLFLHGSVGLGKTHLLQAICHQILLRAPATRILYLSCESFTNQFIAAVENGDLSSFRQKYRNVDVLLVDDIQLLANKERTQEEFFHTFNTIYNLGRQIVLSSDAPPPDIPTLQERLVSRFKMGLVVELVPPEFETRVSILKMKARLRGHELPDDVAHFLAEQVSTNIRELEGAVVRVIGYALLENRPVDLDLAREAARDGSHRRPVVTIHDIISAVCKHFNVKLSDLQSKRRTQSIAFPRQICMYQARMLTNLSLSEIGGYFGGRDHTTVLYAHDKIRRTAERDANLGGLLRKLAREIAG